jgi:DMSO/TMAO reductase YedYZ heme-binding membrane subunit
MATTIIVPPSEKTLYFRTAIFSLILFGLAYSYTNWMGIPGVTNKSVADVSILLMGLSMILSGVCYFWNVFDPLIRYRKHLGLVGFAFALAHVGLSFPALQSLFQVSTWEKGAMWPALTGLLAMVIFAIMALISNSFMARSLGGKTWRYILRTGYLAIILVWFHVVLLKSARWITWYQNGMQTPPSLSLIVSIFMVIVVLMRIALWISLARKRPAV